MLTLIGHACNTARALLASFCFRLVESIAGEHEAACLTLSLFCGTIPMCQASWTSNLLVSKLRMTDGISQSAGHIFGLWQLTITAFCPRRTNNVAWQNKKEKTYALRFRNNSCIEQPVSTIVALCSNAISLLNQWQNSSYFARTESSQHSLLRRIDQNVDYGSCPFCTAEK